MSQSQVGIDSPTSRRVSRSARASSRRITRPRRTLVAAMTATTALCVGSLAPAALLLSASPAAAAGTSASPARLTASASTSAASTTTATNNTAKTSKSVPAMLIVAVHPDDEMALSHLWTGRRDVKKVFLWLDATEMGGSRRINANTGKPVRWDRGEYNPLDHRGGMTTGYFRGSLSNLSAMRRLADRSLPFLDVDKPTRQFMRGDRQVTTWVDPSRGAGISYNSVGVRSTSKDYVKAIEDVTRNPTKYGLPGNYRWTDLVVSSYYNYSGVGGGQCDTYAPRLHRDSHEAAFARAYPQFSGRKYHAICKADEFPNKGSGTVNAAVSRAVYALPRGSIATYFGWLYTGHPPITATKSGVFSAEQWYTSMPASRSR